MAPPSYLLAGFDRHLAFPGTTNVMLTRLCLFHRTGAETGTRSVEHYGVQTHYLVTRVVSDEKAAAAAAEDEQAGLLAINLNLSPLTVRRT